MNASGVRKKKNGASYFAASATSTSTLLVVGSRMRSTESASAQELPALA